MKWFKHYTDSLDDPFIHALIDKFGATGYLAYFGIIEIICKENGKDLTGKLKISPTYLRRKLRTSQVKLRQVYDFCQTFTKLSVNFCDNFWEFHFPKIAEIKDNYTKDLQVTGKKPSNQKEEEKEKEEDKEKDIGQKFKLPAFIPQEEWDGFIEMRKSKKKLITDRARDLIINKLEGWYKEGHDLKNILNNSIINSWTDVYLNKGKKEEKPRSNKY